MRLIADMRRIFIVGTALLALFSPLSPLSPAKAQDSSVPAMTAGGAVSGTDLIYCAQSAGTTNRKCTAAQIAAYINSLFSGDFTAAAGGAATFTTVNANVGSFGNTTSCPTVTVNAKGLITAASQATCTPAMSSVTGRATLAQLPQGIANSIWINPTGSTADMQNVAVPACANDGAHGLVYVNGSGLACATIVAVTSVTPGAGVVSNVTASCSQSAITSAGTVSAAACVNAQTGTSYAIVDGDRAKLVTFSNASPVAVSIAQAGAASAFQNGWYVDVVNKGVGTVTITPTTSTINGTTTLVLTTGQGGRVYSDGTNYQVNAGSGSGGSGISSITPGGGLVSGVTGSCTQTAITTSGTLSESRCLNAQTGTTYAILDGDRGKLITGSNAAAQAYSIAQAGAASAFANGWSTTITNKGVGTLTITPTTSTINGASTYVLFAGQSVRIVSDGSNYQIDPGTTGGIAVSDQTGANYAFVASDFGKAIYLSNGSNQVPTLPNANTLGANWFVQACNTGAGTQTITPATSTIGGAVTFVLPAGSAAAPNCAAIIGDNTNYRVYPDFFRTGANVATAAALALSAAGGLTTTVASGTSALGTGAIGSAACASVVTTAATNVATTDVITWGFNGDPTGVTGYAPLVAGMLTIIGYPTSGNVNWKVCNNTSSSVTPGAITLNWRVVR